MKNQETTCRYLLLRGCTELDNPYVVELRTFQSPRPGDQLAFVDLDGDVFLGPKLTSIADGNYTPVSDLLDFEEISDAVSQGRVTTIRPRHTVWHPPFSISTLLLIWCIILARALNLWWAALILLVLGSIPLAVSISVALLFGRYRGPFLQWRSR